MKQKVAILGASADPQRYSHKAFKMLQQYGHTPIPVNPGIADIEGVKVAKSLLDISDTVETLTMYVGAQRSTPLTEEILKLSPKRVIFNPGSENSELEETLKAKGIEVVEGCTLVMLRTNQF
ncbi:MAG: CoA-binding protein [Bdellovibrionales bacterium]|nr:CoA-binding protein [Bdellovibrionales bacterium]